jgi:hypothetical protein
MAAARTEKAVGAQGTPFFEEQYELKTGKPQDASRGLEDRMRKDKAALEAHIGKGSKGIEEEVREFVTGSPAEGPELVEIVDYVLNQKTSEKEYPNGIRDKGRSGARPAHFILHPNARDAELDEDEVHLLRIYTTFAYKYMNNPLRNEGRYVRRAPVPLPAISRMADDTIWKLLALRVREGAAGGRNVILWRGMRSVRVSEAFMQEGGTELAFMSTTTDLRLRVAVRYSLSRHSLLFNLIAPNFMALGADLQWLSTFPDEAECSPPRSLTSSPPNGPTASTLWTAMASQSPSPSSRSPLPSKGRGRSSPLCPATPSLWARALQRLRRWAAQTSPLTPPAPPRRMGLVFALIPSAPLRSPPPWPVARKPMEPLAAASAPAESGRALAVTTAGPTRGTRRRNRLPHTFQGPRIPPTILQHTHITRTSPRPPHCPPTSLAPTPQRTRALSAVPEARPHLRRPRPLWRSRGPCRLPRAGAIYNQLLVCQLVKTRPLPTPPGGSAVSRPALPASPGLTGSGLVRWSTAC